MTGVGPPHDLLDRSGCDGWVLHPDATLLGMVGERLHAMADGGARRLVARDDEENEERPEFLGGQGLALDIGVHEL